MNIICYVCKLRNRTMCMENLMKQYENVLNEQIMLVQNILD